jgi:hypothetical protein
MTDPPLTFAFPGVQLDTPHLLSQSRQNVRFGSRHFAPTLAGQTDVAQKAICAGGNLSYCLRYYRQN